VYHSSVERVKQQPSVQISAHTRPVARFLVGGGPSVCPYVTRRARQEAAETLQAAARCHSRAPPAPAQHTRGRQMHADGTMAGAGDALGALMGALWQTKCRQDPRARAAALQAGLAQQEVTLREVLVSHVKSP
jgi:hypothetical protein